MMSTPLETFFSTCRMGGMDKQTLINAMGGVMNVAKLVGISNKAVYQWPDILPPRIYDRVIGAAWRQNRIDEIPLPTHNP